MEDITRLNRAGRIFLTRLMIVYGIDAPEILRRLADELEVMGEKARSDDPRDRPPLYPDV